jgi:nitroreductase
MQLRDAVLSRRMIRSYDPDRPLAQELIADLLGLAVRAPSAGHTQGWQFVVVHSPQSRRRFWDITTEGTTDSWLLRMQTAQALVLCLSDKDAYLDRYAEPDKGWTDRDEAHWPVPYWDLDTAMAAMILLLAATDAGLGACFFGIPPEFHAAVHAEFEIPDWLNAIGVVSLGYPAPDLRSPSLKRGRRPFDDVVRFV